MYMVAIALIQLSVATVSCLRIIMFHSAITNWIFECQGLSIIKIQISISSSQYIAMCIAYDYEL